MRNILITGTSSGVGKYLAEKLSNQFNVIGIARRIDKMKQEFKNFKNIYLYECDISNFSELDKTLNKIKNNHGEIYYIINNAGVLKQQSLNSENFFNDLDISIAINAIAPIKIINFFIGEMKKLNFGRIINLTSGAPLNCFPDFGCYSASKAVLNTLTVTLAKELIDYDIKINLMSPGPVKTEMAPFAPMDISVCLDTVNYLLNLKKEDNNYGFYWLGYKVPLFPDLEGVKWLEGIGNEKLIKVL
ncbi:SDR family oxidoreductase [Aliarcobacter cryaerophilus]|uniref:SDR family oxidoreductase n=1 Tax=Aliarcobacter cryaerophilus TaxID=28198 RepID=UPI003DA29826